MRRAKAEDVAVGDGDSDAPPADSESRSLLPEEEDEERSALSELSSSSSNWDPSSSSRPFFLLFPSGHSFCTIHFSACRLLLGGGPLLASPFGPCSCLGLTRLPHFPPLNYCPLMSSSDEWAPPPLLFLVAPSPSCTWDAPSTRSRPRPHSPTGAPLLA